MTADGFSLDDKRNPIDNSDILDIIESWKKVKKDNVLEPDKEDKWFWVEKEEIVANDYDLSINKYKEIEYEEVEYEKPQVILEKIEALEREILSDIADLKGMVK